MVMTVTQVRPANQRLRIAALRLMFAAAFVPLILGVPVWGPAPAAALHVAGIFCIIAAVLGRFWAILYIGGRKNAQVMQDGPYSICRHPLYLFSTIGVAGFGLTLGSVVFAGALGLAGFAILSATAAREERFLRSSFGAAYDDYAARVPRILPKPGLFRTPAQVTFRVDTLRTNMADAAVFLSVIPLSQIIRLAHQSGFLHGFSIW
ncbi:MAG: isoprenylcysteine carboxylmethyltransferase family protein [Paracoccaceae bacterium]